MTKMDYDTVDYAQSRLIGTVVRVGINPVKINAIIDMAHVEVETLVKAKKKMVKMSDLNLEPVELGFVNYNSRAFYVSRMPKRNDWRQGLRLENMHFSECLNGDSEQRVRYDVPSWAAIYQTIHGNYPTIETCLSRIPNINSIAWSRDFAMVRKGSDIKVSYLGDVVVGDMVDGRVRLYDKFNYLEEKIMEAL